MSTDVEVPASSEVSDVHADAQPSADRKMRRTIMTSVAVSIPVSIAFFVGMVALAVHNQQPDWNAWLWMAAGIGTIAGVFFGLLFGFMLSSHLFDD